MKEMTAEFKGLQKQIIRSVADSSLSEPEKYALLSGCIAQVANSYHPCDFNGIRERLSLVCDSMMRSVDAAERMFGKFIKQEYDNKNQNE